MVRVYGEINPKSFVTEIIHPEYEILKTNKPLPEHLTPIYPLTSGLGKKSILSFVKRGFDHIAKKNIFPDHFPELNIKRNLPDLMVSLKKLHMPISNQSSDL